MNSKKTLLALGLLMCIGPVCAAKKASAVQKTASVELGQDAKMAAVKLLEKSLADEYVLLTKLLNYHWNVTGPFFGPLHSLFETQYTQAFKTVDLLAERIRALEGVALGSMAEFLKTTRLSEAPGKLIRDTMMIKDLINDHESISRAMRADLPELQKLGDEATANMLQELIIQHDKSAWMLRSLLAKQKDEK